MHVQVTNPSCSNAIIWINPFSSSLYMQRGWWFELIFCYAAPEAYTCVAESIFPVLSFKIIMSDCTFEVSMTNMMILSFKFMKSFLVFSLQTADKGWRLL